MKISIIGAGAMGGAMAEGMLKLDEMAPEELTVCDHNKPVIDHFASLGASGQHTADIPRHAKHRNRIQGVDDIYNTRGCR